MKKRRKASNNRKVTFVLLALAVILLLGSAVGSTRAALTYYSENYTAEFTVGQIGVSLAENGEIVSKRDFDGEKWVTAESGRTDGLLKDMLGKDEKLALGKPYENELSVKNTGAIDEYVRVRIYRYWTKEGSEEKIPTLAPALIKLGINESEWVIPDKDMNKECIVLYHKGKMAAESASAFVNTIAIDPKVASEFTTETVENEDGTKVVTSVYKYDKAQFHVDVEVDAVQTHNAEEAMKTTWGVDASDLGIL